MNTRSKAALHILQFAIVVGIAADVLLRQMPWGINVLAFNLVFAGGTIFLLKKHAPEQLTAQTLGLFGALLFFATMFMWRDASELRAWDSFAVLTILSGIFLPKLNLTARVAGVVHYGISFAWSSLNALFAPIMLVTSDVEWKAMSDSGWRRTVFSVLRGVAIAAPLILIFGVLFMSADESYAAMVQRVLDIAPETLFIHIFMFGFFAWLSAGYLRGVMLGGLGATVSIFDTTEPEKDSASAKSEDRPTPMERVSADSGEYPVTLPDDHNVVEHINISDAPNVGEPEAETRTAESVSETEKPKFKWPHIENTFLPTGLTLGTVEVGVILGLMNLLFLSFVIMQVPYLFGGMELVQNTPDFKLAQYARHGFGELVAVSALVLPVLLFGQWLIKKEVAGAQRLFKILAGAQIVLLFVVMASAVQRLVLLTGPLGYGMTTVRLYPMIFMIWLAIVFVWFGVTVLRGARQYFAWGALWSAFVVLGVTHVLNPDEFIVKTNVALMREGRPFDGYYNSSLSDDAILALIEAFPDMPEEQQIRVLKQLERRYCWSYKETDLRSWNVSRSRAASQLHSLGVLNERLNCAEYWPPAEIGHD